MRPEEIKHNEDVAGGPLEVMEDGNHFTEPQYLDAKRVFDAPEHDQPAPSNTLEDKIRVMSLKDAIAEVLAQAERQGDATDESPQTQKETVMLSEKEKVFAFEQAEVLRNPEYVGTNFDTDYIIDATAFMSEQEYIQYRVERDGALTEDQLAQIERGELTQYLAKRRMKEENKIAAFREYMARFDGRLKHVRIHPPGECSPVCPSQAVRYDEEGNVKVSISPYFAEQLKAISGEAEDCTLVVQFYDHRKNFDISSEVPKTKEDVEQYIAICEEAVRIAGDDIVLELGNETNVSRKSGKQFERGLQHLGGVDVKEYAGFYFKVASSLKQKFPHLRLSLAGVACFDPEYIREALAHIEELRNQLGIEEKLVDRISFHPYRGDPKDGSSVVRNGTFLGSNKQSYLEQLKIMKGLAQENDVSLNVGEVGFPFNDKEGREKLHETLVDTEKEGVVSLIYPEVNV